MPYCLKIRRQPVFSAHDLGWVAAVACSAGVGSIACPSAELQGGLERSPSFRSDAWHIEPVGWICRNHDGDAAEAFQQGARRRGRDTGDRGEQCLRRLVARSWPGSLRISRPISDGLELLGADGESVDPQRRVALVTAAEERDPLIDDGKADAADCVVVERSAIEVGALDEQVRKGAGCAKLPELWPKRPLRTAAWRSSTRFGSTSVSAPTA